MKHRNPYLIERDIAEETRRRDFCLGLAGWIGDRIAKGFPDDDVVRLQRLRNEMFYGAMCAGDRIEALNEELAGAVGAVRRAAGLEEVRQG